MTNNYTLNTDYLNEQTEFANQDELASYLLELIKVSCVQEGIISNINNWETYGGRKDIFWKRNPIDFTQHIKKVIELRKSKIFKNGTKENKTSKNIKIYFLDPTENEISAVESGELEWLVVFEIEEYLTPRYLKDGDK